MKFLINRNVFSYLIIGPNCTGQLHAEDDQETAEILQHTHTHARLYVSPHHTLKCFSLSHKHNIFATNFHCWQNVCTGTCVICVSALPECVWSSISRTYPAQEQQITPECTAVPQHGYHDEEATCCHDNRMNSWCIGEDSCLPQPAYTHTHTEFTVMTGGFHLYSEIKTITWCGLSGSELCSGGPWSMLLLPAHMLTSPTHTYTQISFCCLQITSQYVKHAVSQTCPSLTVNMRSKQHCFYCVCFHLFDLEILNAINTRK